MKKLLLAVVLCGFSSTALACGGGGYGGESLSPRVKEAMREAMRAEQARAAELDRTIANFDRAIAAVKAADLVFGQVVSLLPGGSAAHSGGKTAGHVAMGNIGAAAKSAITGVLGAMGDTSVAAKTVNVAIHANDAVSVGNEVGDAFGG